MIQERNEIPEVESRRAAEPLPTGNLDSLCNLASGIAHELRNPLNTVSLAFQLLQTLLEQKGFDLGIELEDHFRKIHFELGKMRKILDNFTRFNPAGNLTFEALDLRGAIDRAVARTACDFERSRIELRDEFPTGCQVLGDLETLTEALIHVLNNALDAMPDGGEVIVRRGEGGEGYRIHISDCGPGITDADRDRVFEPYFTTHPSRLGVGLTIASGIVRAHQGTIRIDAQPDGGTDVMIEIPRHGTGKEGTGPDAV